MLLINNGMEVRIQPYLWDVAEVTADLILMINAKAGHWDGERDRGDQARDVAINGVMGELVVKSMLRFGMIKFTSPPVLSRTPQPEPDIIVGDEHYDVKAVPIGVTEMRVNKAAHGTGNDYGKGITHYWFVDFIDPGFARNYVFPYDEISTWEVKKRFTEYYSKEIQQMQGRGGGMLTGWQDW